MGGVLKPCNEVETARVLSWAMAERKSLELVAGGTKRSIGRPMQTENTLNLSELTGISLYEPGELVLSAKAGTAVSDIKTVLEGQNQQLAFDPPDLSQFLRSSAKIGTIGGAVATNLSGPRRISAGAARDHLLGMRAVTGRAETVNIGGRVMKNVTGYDLCKLLAGSWGTLVAMTEVTLKVVPRPEAEMTTVVFGLSIDEAVRAMSVALGSSASVSGAAHFSAKLAARSEISEVSLFKKSVTALRIEGFLPSVRARKDILANALKSFGEVETLDENISPRVWREVRDVTLFDSASEDAIWRISTVPGRAPDVVRNISRCENFEALYDWGGGRIWLMQPGYGDGGAEVIRTVLDRFGGHAMLMRASPEMRSAVNVFEPQSDPVAALTRRIKAAYDPYAILSPGRMYAGV